MFVLLATNTERGFPKWETRLEMVSTVNLLLTFIVFWTLLAPSLPVWYLLSYDNLSIHIITPLLLLADYIIFSEAGRLKYKDVYFTCVFPLIYLAFVIIIGAKPYFFLDFEKTGFMVFVYIAAILLLLILLGHCFYFFDKKIRKKTAVSETVSVKARKPFFTVIIWVLTVAVCVTAGVIASKSRAEINTKTLRVGIYYHDSGDPEKYIEVFDDGTLQIFGFDYYEYEMSFSESPNFVPPSDIIKQISEQLKERHEYSVRPLNGDDDRINIKIDDDFVFASPCMYIDDYTLIMEGVYKYSGR